VTGQTQRPAAHARPAAVLFDAGGTLVQVRIGRIAAALRSRGVDADGLETELDAALWRTMVLAESRFSPEVGAHDAWWSDWLETWADGAGVPFRILRAAWQEVDRDENPWSEPLPGVTACLTRLREAGVRLGVVSNADGRVAEGLARVGLASFFEVIVDSTAVGVAKPDPRIFDYAFEVVDEPRERTWYVGDTVAYDATAADAAGLVSWIVDHRGLHTVPHPRRVGDLAALADAALAG
jgi:HAD superfamily hydrolase (TIGR01509 family)